jgi:hypothetical protein
MTLNNPFSQPLHFFGLELTIIGAAAFTLVHALRRWRAGRGRDLYLWASTFLYGVFMELITYNTFDNFNHGRFSVMLYHDRLPLYVSAFYPLLQYLSIQAVGRLGLSRAAEPFAAGLAIVLLDVPFDILGPALGWWNWSPTDENLRFRWLGVPVTSYYWHLAFGGCLAFWVRTAERLIANPRWGRLVVMAPLTGAATIVAGIFAFIPFHLLKRIGVADGTVVFALIAASGAVLLFARRVPGGAPDRLLLCLPFVYHAYFVTVLIVVGNLGQIPRLGVTAAVIAGVTACSLGLHLYLQLGRLALAPRPAPE